MVAKKLDSICKDYTKIENYDAAVSDTTQMWICHHRNEQSAESRKHSFYKCIETGEVHSSSEWGSLGYRACRLKDKGLHFEKCNNGRAQLS